MDQFIELINNVIVHNARLFLLEMINFATQCQIGVEEVMCSILISIYLIISAQVLLMLDWFDWLQLRTNRSHCTI